MRSKPRIHTGIWVNSRSFNRFESSKSTTIIRSPPNSHGPSNTALHLPPGCKKENKNRLFPKSLHLFPFCGHQILPRVCTIPSANPGLVENSFPTASGIFPDSFASDRHAPCTPLRSYSVSLRPCSRHPRLSPPPPITLPFTRLLLLRPPPPNFSR